MADGELLQRFTPQAIRVIQYAKEEARRFAGSTVGTEHVLLGLIREREGIAARVLDDLGVSLGRAQSEVRRQMEATDKEPRQKSSHSWSPAARRVLELALDEARELNPKLGLPNFVDTEHLLLGLIREADCTAVRVLRALGVGPDQARERIMALLQGSERRGDGLRAALRSLVEHPDQVSVKRVEDDLSIRFEIRVAAEDLDRVIGEGGRIADALRSQVRAAGRRERKAIWVEINKQIVVDDTRWIERAQQLGAAEAKIISPASVITAPWVRLKCQFGCGGYGLRLTCPPHSPTPEQTRAVLDCYESAILVHCPGDGNWRSIKQIVADLEREVFLAGHYKAFAFGSGPCDLCSECNLESCVHPHQARPAMEAAGIDVFATARGNGFPIEVVRDHACPQNYYGLVLIE